MQYFLYLIMIMTLGDANAADVFSPVANDQSVKLLNAIFPGLTGSGGADAMASSMGVFNSAILMIGGILATYTILAGTLGTAHDGEMLGKKFSSIWLPIRYALGTALVLPVVGGGYNIIQSLVMWCVMQSVGLADSVWTKFVSSQNITNIAAVSIQSPDAKQLAYTTLNIQVCMANLSWAQNGGGDNLVHQGINNGITIEDGIVNKTYYFGNKDETLGLKKDSCGSVAFTKFKAPVQTATGFTNFLSSFGNAEKIIVAQETQFSALSASLAPIATQIYKTNKPADTVKITSIINTYQANVAKSAADMILNGDAFSDLSKNASQDGWATAGFWFVKLSNLTDLTQRSLASIPNAIGPAPSNAALMEHYAQTLPAILETMNKGGANIVGLGMGNEAGGSNSSWWDNVKSSIANLDPTIIIKKAFTSSVNFAIQDGEHPLMSLKRLGNTTLAMAGAGFSGILGVIVVLGTVNPGLALTLAGVMFSICIPLAIIGITLSYIIPFMPALIWIGILIGWFVQVFEAVIAASVWAIMHLHPSGDDAFGKGGNGYSLLLGILFRPVLAVIGFMGSLLSLQIFGEFINKVFADTFLISQQDSGIFIWLVGMVVAPLIYCIVMWTTVKKLFELMHIISDELMKWIGGAGQVLGDMAKSLGSGGDHSQQIAAGINVANSAGNNALGGIEKHLNGKSFGNGLKSTKNISMDKTNQSVAQNDISKMMQGDFDSNKDIPFSVASMKSQHESSIKDLNSVSPELGSQYQKTLSKMSDNPKYSNLSSDGIMKNAVESTLRQNYGKGAVSAMKGFSGGSLSGEKFQSALSSYETAKQGAVADFGSVAYKKEMISASSAINADLLSNSKLSNDNKISPAQIFDKHLSKFNDLDTTPTSQPFQSNELTQPISDT